MEVQFPPDVEKKPNDLAARSGRGTAAALVQDVVEGYFEELAHLRRRTSPRFGNTSRKIIRLLRGVSVKRFSALFAQWFRSPSKATAERNRGGLHRIR